MTKHTMTGEQIVKLFKTIKTVKGTAPLGSTVELMGSERITLLQVTNRETGPVFGVIDHDHLIDTGKIANTKFDKRAIYAVSIQDDELTFENDNEVYRFTLFEPDIEPSKIPVLHHSDSFYSIDAKKLLDSVKKAAQINQDVKFSTSHIEGVLTVSTSNLDGSFTGKLHPATHPFTDTIIDCAFLTPTLATVSGNVCVQVTDEGPLMLSWVDKWFDYVLYIAPKLRNE